MIFLLGRRIVSLTPFDRYSELNKLINYVGRLGILITLVLGLRRVGKSSLILVALRELGLPHIYIDLRKFEEARLHCVVGHSASLLFSPCT